ncbi:hypothetical protein [Methanolobus vulcani]|uniref:Energy-coupling factor transport system substrate-specific component n=1 Tax=Methanolobus vulcani TaxID=38026 RepID=A0A7Z8KLY0_9EURY|nr:hypothetical protein [Methanolobus vulcani]TQD23976.1 hypothetical protein FKV42_12310 [Methanolobus vulcani]
MYSKLLPKLRVKNDVKVVYIVFGIVLTYFSVYMPDFMEVAGIDNVQISSTVSFSALNGMLFGPFWGALVTLSGISLYKITAGTFFTMSAFSLLSLIFNAMASIVSGLVVNREYKAAKTIFFSFICIWYLLDVGRTAYLYPWYHLLVLGAFVYFHNTIIKKSITSKLFVFISLFFASLLGVLTDHMAGSIAYYLLYDLPASAYNSVILVYPVERTILAFFPAFLMYVLVVVFKDIVLSSESIEQDISNRKSHDLDEYIKNDVLDILKKEEK